TVTEDLETKLEVLRQAERTVSPEAVITSNSSSLSTNQISESLQDPARFCGYHFFHPPQLTSVVEIITSKQTTPRTVEFLRQVSRDIGRKPLVVKDEGGGSCINVVLTCISCEALYILEQGLALPSQIDAIVGRIARIGPCESLDVVGIPFFVEVLGRTLDAFPFDFVVPELLHKLTREGRLGKYVGRGIYLYPEDRPTDDALAYYVNTSQTHSPGAAPSDEASLSERLLFPIYFSVLRLAEMGLGEVSDLCLGIQDLIGMKIDPLKEMRKLGSDGLKKGFDRLRRDLGPRYDYSSLEDVMARLDNDG
ncbi:MAG: 3-hydroxyacyl-CoA dehydrogenase family protein, partial [Planctomycetota bacterium]